MKTAGFSIIAVVFIILILALVGTYIISVAGLTGGTSNIVMQGVRAYFAAKSGLEWGTYQVVTNSACFTSPTTLSLTQGGLFNFQATVTCTAVPVTEGSTSYTIFRLSSQGFYGTLGTRDYVSRQLNTDVTSTAADNI